MVAGSGHGLLMDLTITITSMGRPDLLIRVIDQLEQNGFDGKLLIGDASTIEDANQVWNRLRTSNLDHRFVHHERMSVPDFHRVLGRLIDTTYSLCIADGGVLVTETLESYVSFLDAHPDYVAVSGDVFLFNRLNTNKIQWLGQYAMPILPQDRALDRVAVMAENYRVPMYCVMRSEAWKTAWMYDSPTELDSLANEIIPAFSLFLIGKFGYINRPFLLREMHKRRHSLTKITETKCKEKYRKSFVKLGSILSQRAREIGFVDTAHLMPKVMLNFIEKNLCTIPLAVRIVTDARKRLLILLYRNTIVSSGLMRYKLLKFNAERSWIPGDLQLLKNTLIWLDDKTSENIK